MFASARSPLLAGVAVVLSLLVWVLVAAVPAGAALFTPASGSPLATGAWSPSSVAVADFNGDGNLDAVVLNSQGPGGNPPPAVSVLLGDGKGGFSLAPGSPVPVGGPGARDLHADSLAVADFNKDGRPDVAVVLNDTDRIGVLLDDGSGSLSPAPGSPFPVGSCCIQPVSVAAGDFNRDGNPDVAVSNRNSANIAVLVGDGTGRLAFSSSFGNVRGAIVTGDFNGDGKVDVALSGGSVFLGDGNGGFTPAPGSPYNDGGGCGSLSAAVADLNRDNNMDVVWTRPCPGPPSVSVLLGAQNGPLSFAPGSPYATTTLGPNDWPEAAAVGDLNLDGKPDVVTANVFHHVSVLLGDGTGAVSLLNSQATNGDTGSNAIPVSIAVGDFNRDGRPDVITANSSSVGTVSVLLNQFDAYPRPRGATPTRASLTPAFRQCTSSNTTHGSPLAYGSCNPPQQASRFLTIGTPDANSAGAGAIGSVLYRVQINTPPTPNDLLLNVSTTDVRCQLPVNTTCGSVNDASGPDYTGQLQATESVRITDKLNGSGTNEPGTVADATFPIIVPCAATTDMTIGSTCSTSTSANAIMPGAVTTSGARAIWELGQVKVYDGGASGVAGSSDATLFMDEGVFVP